MATKGRDELELARAEAGAKDAELGGRADATAALCGLLHVPAGTDVLPVVRALVDRAALLQATQAELQAAREDLRGRVDQLGAALEVASRGGAAAQKRAEELEKEIKGLRKELGVGEGPPPPAGQPGSAWLIEARTPTGRPLEQPFYRARARGKGPSLWTHDAAAAERFASEAEAWDAIAAQLDAAAGIGLGRMVPACHGDAR